MNLLVLAGILGLGSFAANSEGSLQSLPVLTPLPDSASTRLDGRWLFNPAPPPDFWKEDAGSEGWAPIEVPGEWVMQGFSVAKDAAAGYRRAFAGPESLAGRRLKLRFDGVFSECTVWVNGKEVGGHLGGFTPFELDITEAVRPGDGNVLALAVKNESLADTLASATQYAVHPLGGITRKVTLFTVPETHVARLHVNTIFDAAYENASANVAVTITNEGKAASGSKRVRLSFQDMEGKTVEVSGNEAAGPEGATCDLELKMAVNKPRKWDPEHPYLYTLTCELMNGNVVVETIRRKIGFRQIEVRGCEVFVNNHPVKLHGVCRHEAHPLRGRSLTDDLWRKDAELFRDANVNYIRTSHYPPAEEFIEACDELGLFVEEEAPLCWVGHDANPIWKEWNPKDTRYQAYIVQATLEMIERDRNHPSVLIWSLANESMWGPSFEKSLKAADAADPTRPKSFHDQAWGGFNHHSSTAQIAVYHYPTPAEADRGDANNRPMLFGEYCHLNCYNREEIVTDPGLRDDWGRPFAAMWDKMYKSKGCLGGAVWSGIDDVFQLPRGAGCQSARTTVGYGEWGPIDGWRRTKPEYWHFKMAYSPVVVSTKELPAQAPGEPLRIPVENRHDFTNLSEIRIDWKCGDETGTAQADVAPRENGFIEIPISKPNAADLDLKFTSPRGFVICEYLLKAKEERPEWKSGQGAIPHLAETEDAIRVASDDIAWTIDKKTGRIAAGAIKDISVVTDGPDLMVLPIKGNGDTQMTGEKKTYPAFTETCHDWWLDKVTASQTDKGVAVVVEGTYTEAAGKYELLFEAGGVVEVKYHFAMQAEINPRQVGIVLRIAKAFDTLEWDRNAQWSVYPAGHIGRPTGKAAAFREVPDDAVNAKPEWSWELENTPLGTNDFRATRRNIRWAALKNKDGYGLRIESDGKQHARAWIDGDSICLLIANVDTGSGEGFFAAHYADERRPLKKGDVVEGVVRFRLIRGD